MKKVIFFTSTDIYFSLSLVTDGQSAGRKQRKRIRRYVVIIITIRKHFK